VGVAICLCLIDSYKFVNSARIRNLFLFSSTTFVELIPMSEFETA
jgi:hypothetical protein